MASVLLAIGRRVGRSRRLTRAVAREKYGTRPTPDQGVSTAHRVGFVKYSIAIYFMHYNFVRIHQTLKVTPVMAAGVSPKLWEMSDMVKVLEDWEASRAAVDNLGCC